MNDEGDCDDDNDQDDNNDDITDGKLALTRVLSASWSWRSRMVDSR